MMLKTQHELVEYLAQEIRNRISLYPATCPMVAFGGWPFMGKTTVISRLADQFPSAAVIPAEAFIKPRSWRVMLGIDGCAEGCHEMGQLQRVVDGLRQYSHALLDVYDWQRGDHTGEIKMVYTTPGSAIFVDGTVSTLLKRRPQDISVFFKPNEEEEWIKHAVTRDTTTRNWHMDRAHLENRKKAITCKEFESRSIIDLMVRVSPYMMYELP